jgi:hypothetical protein
MVRDALQDPGAAGLLADGHEVVVEGGRLLEDGHHGAFWR